MANIDELKLQLLKLLSMHVQTLSVREKELVNLTCEAQGYPQPQILWRREDGRAIMASGMARDKGDQLAGGYKAVAVIFGFTQTQEFANVVGSQQV